MTNLLPYLRHLDECELNNCKWCKKPKNEHSYRGDYCPQGVSFASTRFELSTCTCDLDKHLARLDERERLNDYVRHKEECNVSNWVERGDAKCNCGLDDLNYKHDDLHERERMGQGLNRWIYSKDGSPDDRGTYIVMDAKLNCVQYNTWDRIAKRWVFNHEHITHWMALAHVAPPNPPPDLTRQIINLLGEYSQTITQDAGTTRFFALVEDNFKDVAGDIMKIWEGKG